MKIFITIGTQIPFDRLIKWMDDIVESFDINDLDVEAQVSETHYVTKNIQTVGFISPMEFESKFQKADLIISHAGMGTIISALTMDKPIIVVPRLASLNEHRNDHQLATAKAFADLKYIYVAYDKAQLKEFINIAIEGKLNHLYHLDSFASPSLISSIKEFIEEM